MNFALVLGASYLLLYAFGQSPICTPHSGLCHVTFDMSETDPLAGQMKYTSSSKICNCPNQTLCPNITTDPSRVLYQEMSSPGQTITTRLSYCDLMSFPVQECDQYEVAMTLRGIGPMIADIVGNVTCKCSGPLVLYNAMPHEMYSVRKYTCGKPTCNVNSSEPSVCERVSFSMSMFGYSTDTEIPCQCPDGFICNTNIPVKWHTMFGDATEFYCEPAQ